MALAESTSFSRLPFTLFSARRPAVAFGCLRPRHGGTAARRHGIRSQASARRKSDAKRGHTHKRRARVDAQLATRALSSFHRGRWIALETGGHSAVRCVSSSRSTEPEFGRSAAASISSVALARPAWHRRPSSRRLWSSPLRHHSPGWSVKWAAELHPGRHPLR